MKTIIYIILGIFLLTIVGVSSKTISENKKIELIKIENQHQEEMLKLKLKTLEDINININININIIADDSLSFDKKKAVAASKENETRKAIESLLNRELEIAVGESIVY